MGVYPCPGCGAFFVSVTMSQAPHAPDCPFSSARRDTATTDDFEAAGCMVAEMRATLMPDGKVRAVFFLTKEQRHELAAHPAKYPNGIVGRATPGRP